MKIYFFLIAVFFLSCCSKPKTVYICGDHICINKSEAKQYFEENLSIEVKVINKKKDKKMSLVELNLKENNSGRNQVTISSKQMTNKKLRTLSNEEVVKIKKKIKNEKKVNKLNKKKANKDNIKIVSKENNLKEKKIKNAKTLIKKNAKSEKINNSNKIVNKNTNELVDVCTILEKCSIDEISKYLIKTGMKENFPDITKRQ